MNISKNLVMSLVLAVMVLSGLLVYQSFGQKSVLGENTVAQAQMERYPTQTIGISLPPQEGICSDLVRLTNRYCQINKPSAPPMEVTVILNKPTPTSPACRTGVASFSPMSPCTAISQGRTFASAAYKCFDGYSGEVKLEKGECMTSTQLQIRAINACSGRSNCKITPPIYDDRPKPSFYKL